MRHKILNEGTERTFAIIFEYDDEVLSGLTQFAADRDLSASHFTAIGAFSSVVLGYFDWEKKDYRRIPLDQQVEVLSLIGDVGLRDTAHSVHAHVVVGLYDGSTRGGHLLEARVRPTLEVMLTESPGYLKRTFDARSGLALISLDD